MAAAVGESLRAGRAAGCESWLRENIAEALGAAMVDRLEQGSIRHAVRRADEMAAASELLGELGIPARIAAASRDWLPQLAQEAAGEERTGKPDAPPRPPDPAASQRGGPPHPAFPATCGPVR